MPTLQSGIIYFLEIPNTQTQQQDLEGLAKFYNCSQGERKRD
ncbi:hypothetical protein [Fischerella sp.]|nr:hypothetical protein [Fischerella sp.]